MFTLNRIALVPAPEGIDLFTQKNGDFGAISVTERGCAAPGRSRQWRVTYRIGSVPHLSAV